MKFKYFVFAVCVALTSGSDLDSELQAILDNARSQSGNVSLMLGVALPNRTISLSAGHLENQNLSSPPLKHSDRFALGSTDKMYTGAAVIRLVESGQIESLDSKALPLMEKFWAKLTNITLTQMLGPQMVNVTVRHLLSMRSGILDMDTTEARDYQLDHPDAELGPVKSMNFIAMQTGKMGEGFQCAPGLCGMYSSSNYVLAGLILAQAAGDDSWDEYDQKSSLPADVLAGMPTTTWALHGKCSKYTRVHGYTKTSSGQTVDVYNISCLAGWTCGNLMSNTADAAYFVRAYLGSERIVSKAMRAEIMKLQPFEIGWNIGLWYGLGIAEMKQWTGQQDFSFIGHGGDTYGFNAMTGYSAHGDFGISIGANTENTMVVVQTLQQVYAAVAANLSGTSRPHQVPVLV